MSGEFTFGDPRLPERFWSKVRVVESGCWEWTASRISTGYGCLKVEGVSRLAHRLSCGTFRGSPPDGAFCLHACDNPPCVNPAHLRWGTQAENQRDMAKKNRGRKSYLTHCGLGHEFTPDNIYVAPGSKTRQCRECHRRWWREWNTRRREQSV